MPRREPSASAQIDDPERRPEIIGVVRQLVAELRGRRAGTVDVSPRSRLDRDLGIDSLGRTELILRIERALRVRLPSSAVAEVETIGDLLAAIENLPQRRTSALPAMPAPASLPPVSAPVEALTLREELTMWPRRILTPLLIPHLRGRHRLPHPLHRPRLRIRIQIDHVSPSLPAVWMQAAVLGPRKQQPASRLRGVDHM